MMFEIIGHRGASADAPENTLASVHLAWRQQADAVEVDVQLTKDGRIVVFHDADTLRIGGRDRAVADQTLAELQTLNVGRWKGAEWAGERVPTLADVVATIPDGKRLFIEVKTGPEIAAELQRVLHSCGKKPQQTVVIGFWDAALRAVKHALPDVPVYLIDDLQEEPQTGRWLPTADALIERVAAAGLDGLDLSACEGIDADFVAAVKRAGLPLYLWTVNSLEVACRARDLGVAGVATDRPGWLRERLRARGG